MHVLRITAAGLLMSAALACGPGERQEIRDEGKEVGSKVESIAEDGTVTAAVKAKLLADQTVSGTRIDVDTRNGVVTLTGTVANSAARTRANELARSTEGVTRVEDKLTVAP